MIIKSLLDGDLYKFTMQQAVVKLYPDIKVKYTFVNRNKTPFPEGFSEKLRKEVKEMESLSLTLEEKDFLKKQCYFLQPSYIDLLYGYRFDSSEIGIIQTGNDLQISIEGYWYKTILWETTLMALISELYFKETNQLPEFSKEKRKQNNTSKAQLFALNGIQYADFGTRRRYSYEIHDELIRDFINYSLKNENFIGTSNVHFAHKYKIKPIGTMAHEWISFHAALYGYKIANYMALESWINVYKGDLGIALPDTFTSDAFFKSFDKKQSKLFDGIRHDSGDPIEFANKTIKHYQSLGIDPLSKTIVFSDNLNPNKVIDINKQCKSKIKCSYGIGTNFTNDIGVNPLNIVIKLTSAKINGEWFDCIKLSDNDGKHIGTDREIEICKYILNIQ